MLKRLMWRLLGGVVDFLIFENRLLHYIMQPLLVAWADSRFFRGVVKTVAVVATALLLTYLFFWGTQVMGHNEGIFGYESDGKIPLKQFVASLLVSVAILVLRHELWWVIKVPFRLLYALAMMPAIAAAGLSIVMLVLMKFADSLEEGARGHLWKERFDKAGALALWSGTMGLLGGMISHRCLGGTWINIEVGIFAAIVAALEYALRKEWLTLPEGFQMPDMFDEGYGGALSCLLRREVEKLPERKE